MNWELAPGAYSYRPLSRLEPPMTGVDVYALQSAFRGFGFELALDGVLGDKTAEAIWHYQESRNLVVDGIAGIATQRDLALALASRFRAEYRLPTGLPRGHIEKESGFQLGNYTAPYTAGSAVGSRDLGVVQRNTRFHKIEDAFDVMDSLKVLCERVVAYHREYVDHGEVNSRRAWELACGSWNAPAYTDYLAGLPRGLKPGPTAHDALNAYIKATTAYTKWAQKETA